MKFTAALTDLAPAVEFAARMANRNTAIAVTAGVLVEAGDDEITITGTDGRIWAEARLEASVEAEGRIVVPAAGLVGWLRGVGRGGRVVLEADESGLSGTADSGYRCRLVQIGLTFPKVEWPHGDSWQIDLSELGTAMKAVVHATAEGEGLLSNIAVRSEGPKLTCVGTDSYRLIRSGGVKVSKANGVGDLEVIIPRETVERVASIGGGRGEIGFGGGHLVGFRNEDRTRAVLSRVTAGKFPTADQLLDRAYAWSWLVSKDELSQALTRLRPFVGGRDLLVLQFGEKSLTIEASSVDIGDATEQITAERHGTAVGGDVLVGIGATFLTEAKGAVRGETIEFRASSGEEPVLVVSEDQVELIAPVRLGG